MVFNSGLSYWSVKKMLRWITGCFFYCWCHVSAISVSGTSNTTSSIDNISILLCKILHIRHNIISWDKNFTCRALSSSFQRRMTHHQPQNLLPKKWNWLAYSWCLIFPHSLHACVYLKLNWLHPLYKKCRNREFHCC